MGILSIILSFFLLSSYNKNIKNEKSDLVDTIDQEIKFSPDSIFSLDSIVVNYWKSAEANGYRFNLTRDFLLIGSEYFYFHRKIKSDSIRKEFMNFINTFYIDKTEEIIISRNKLDYIESTHPSEIQAIGYKNKIEIFNEKTPMDEEEYDIEFNPKFLDFYEFLDSLVSNK